MDLKNKLIAQQASWLIKRKKAKGSDIAKLYHSQLRYLKSIDNPDFGKGVFVDASYIKELHRQNPKLLEDSLLQLR